VTVRSEAHNLPRRVGSLRDVSEVWVIDSDSTDSTIEIAAPVEFTSCSFTTRGMAEKT